MVHLKTIRILDQTPHSLFWDYDAVGYMSMGLATLGRFAGSLRSSDLGRY